DDLHGRRVCSREYEGRTPGRGQANGRGQPEAAFVKPEIVIEAPQALAHVFADRFAAEARSAIAAARRISRALPGGSVAETFFPGLARGPVAWDQVEFFWGDERAVGPDDPESNYGLAKRLLLDPVRADPRRVHRMAGEGDDLEAAARAYEQEMVRVL